MSGDLSVVSALLGRAEFPGRTDQVADVRRWADRLLSAAGVPPAQCAATVLALSELTTNAVLHTASGRLGGVVRVDVFAGDGTVRVEVADDGGAASVPVALQSGPWSEHGRGLTLVSAVTDAWGVLDGEDSGVWAEVR